MLRNPRRRKSERTKTSINTRRRSDHKCIYERILPPFAIIPSQQPDLNKLIFYARDHYNQILASSLCSFIKDRQSISIPNYRHVFKPQRLATKSLAYASVASTPSNNHAPFAGGFPNQSSQNPSATTSPLAFSTGLYCPYTRVHSPFGGSPRSAAATFSSITEAHVMRSWILECGWNL